MFIFFFSRFLLVVALSYIYIKKKENLQYIFPKCNYTFNYTHILWYGLNLKSNIFYCWTIRIFFPIKYKY